MSENESPKAEPSANPNPNPNHKRGSDSSKDQIDGSGVVKKLKTERFFEIEADVAEDKGSRHTMEDTSVAMELSANVAVAILVVVVVEKVGLVKVERHWRGEGLDL